MGAVGRDAGERARPTLNDAGVRRALAAPVICM